MTTISAPSPILTGQIDRVLGRVRTNQHTRPAKEVMAAMKGGREARLAAQNFASTEGAPMPPGILRQINRLA